MVPGHALTLGILLYDNERRTMAFLLKRFSKPGFLQEEVQKSLAGQGLFDSELFLNTVPAADGIAPIADDASMPAAARGADGAVSSHTKNKAACGGFIHNETE